MPVEASYLLNILAFMSQENDYIEPEEVLEEEIDEVEEDNLEDDEDNNESEGIDWKERALKAEQAIIKSKSKKQNKPVKKQEVSNYQSQIDLLRFNGVTSDEIEQLKKISEFEGVDLIDAKNSEMFDLWKEKKEKERQSKEASLASSNRGSQTQNTKQKLEKRVGGTDKWTKDDVKAMVHGS